ncbi:hypothetical protein M422DRAFT_184126, partial [Sphaerobolus stellatus SS14]
LGPPRTGKTTVVSEAAEVWTENGHSVWITAQSNVAVKNMAGKLSKRNINFKIIVLKEFYFEWHKHIYEKIEGYIIRSDESPEDRTQMERVLGGSVVILTTLSMLSNPGLDINGTFSLVPKKKLVVDETSQISIFEYMIRVSTPSSNIHIK